MNYKLIEDFGSYRQPVGSVLENDGKRIYYRNITDRHIFKKDNYEALFVDDCVIEFLGKEDKIDLVVFEHTSKGIYSVPFKLYKQAGVKKMAGRKQRGITLTAFNHTENSLKLSRPIEEKTIYLGGGNN